MCPLQAGRPDITVIAIVRNPTSSSHLNAAIAGLQNVHVVAADVAYHATFEVRASCLYSGPLASSYILY